MERSSYAVCRLQKSLLEAIVQRLGTPRGAAMLCATIGIALQLGLFM